LTAVPELRWPFQTAALFCVFFVAFFRGSQGFLVHF
jgi:hypothetical protein